MPKMVVRSETVSVSPANLPCPQNMRAVLRAGRWVCEPIALRGPYPPTVLGSEITIPNRIVPIYAPIDEVQRRLAVRQSIGQVGAIG